MTGEPLLRAWQVADLLGQTTRWVLDQAAAGELPSFKVGKSVRFRASEVEVWLDARRRGVQSSGRHLHAIGGM